MPTISYKTDGQLTSIGDLYDKLISFLVNQAGWTLVADLGLRDKVYSTTGESGLEPTAYVRLTENLHPHGMPQLSCGSPPNITVRGYVDYNTNLFPFGLIGPEIKVARAGNSYYSFNPVSRKSILNGKTLFSSIYTPGSAPYTWSIGADGVIVQKDGGRTLKGADSSGLVYIADLARDNGYNSNFGDGTPWRVNSHVFVIDNFNADSYFYYLSSSTTTGKVFARKNIRLGTTEYLADPPWSALTQNKGKLCFDGNDIIYAMRGDNTAEFAKYTISTNTWTLLSSSPITRGTTGDNHDMFYLPASVTGFAEDRIYVWINTNSASSFYYYNVTSNTWTQAAAVPTTTTSSNYGYLFTVDGTTIQGPLSTSSANTLYIYDVINDTWSSDVTAFSSSASQTNIATRLYHFYPGTLKGPPSKLFDWWITGNKDYVTVIFRETFNDGSTRYRYLHFGYYNSRLSTTRYSLSNAVSPGTGVTINLGSDPTAEVSPGTFWLLVDPSTGITEQVEILSVNTTSVTVRQLVNSMTASAYLSQDPHPFVITDGNHAATAFSLDGYQPDGIMHWWYVHSPYDGQLDKIAVSDSNTIAFREMILMNNESDYYKVDDIIGSLKGVYMIPNTGSFPKPGDEIQIGSVANALIIYPEEFGTGVEDRYIAILLN